MEGDRVEIKKKMLDTLGAIYSCCLVNVELSNLHRGLFNQSVSNISDQSCNNTDGEPKITLSLLENLAIPVLKI